MSFFGCCGAKTLLGWCFLGLFWRIMDECFSSALWRLCLFTGEIWRVSKSKGTKYMGFKRNTHVFTGLASKKRNKYSPQRRQFLLWLVPVQIHPSPTRTEGTRPTWSSCCPWWSPAFCSSEALNCATSRKVWAMCCRSSSTVNCAKQGASWQNTPLLLWLLLVEVVVASNTPLQFFMLFLPFHRKRKFKTCPNGIHSFYKMANNMNLQVIGFSPCFPYRRVAVKQVHNSSLWRDQ